MSISRFEVHSHTHYSNIRLLDSINRPKDLIDRAIDNGLCGISITDHECLGAAIEVKKYEEKIREKNSSFKVALGNEIYLCKDRNNGQKYYHFILISKNKEGFKALRELSSRAWMNSWYDRGMERVVTLYEDLEDIVSRFPNSLIATSACFRKGSKVLTKLGEKNIEDINNDDYVLNMYGKWEKVNFPTSREYSGRGYKITFLENETPTICTENHKFLVTTCNKITSYKKYGKNPLSWVEAKNLNLKSDSSKNICLFPVLENNYSNKKFFKREEWEYTLLDSSHLRKKKIKNTIEITPELMRTFGLFLGDGSISINKEKKNYYSLSFSFNYEEFDYYWDSFFKKASENIGATWSKTERREINRIDLTSHSIDLVEFFYYIFGDVKANNKYIPEKIKNISKELDCELIFGYELADGYFRTHINKKKNIESGEMVSASISKKLSYDIHNLLLGLKIRNSIYYREGKIDKNKINHKESWYISSSNNAWRNIKKKKLYSHKDVIDIFNAAKEFCSNRYIKIDNVYYKKVYIKKREEIELNEKVYCLNVNSHSFVCNNVVVHNCLGGYLSSQTLELIKLEKKEDKNKEDIQYTKGLIDSFINYCKRLFKEDFYIECAPAKSREQILVNKRLVQIAKYYNIKMVIGSDAHYLKKEDRYVHNAYLNSKGGERETEGFYDYAYLQDENEIKENIEASIPEEYENMIKNSYEIYNKIEDYSLFHKQVIPKVDIEFNKDLYDYSFEINEEKFPNIYELLYSKNIQEKYWINECLESLKDKKIDREKIDKYLERLEIEAKIIKIIGGKLEDCLFAYFNTFKHYIDLFWECGSIVGPGRGSSTGFLSNYLLGITQLDPIQWNLYYWRFLNETRAELPDIDIDLAPSKRKSIIKKIKKERGEKFKEDIDELSRRNLGCTLVATYGTETTKSTILTAARGYRSEDFPDGIDNDTAQYLSSLIPSERGFLWELKDVINGNPEKDRKPVVLFLREVEKYPRLLEIMISIEGLGQISPLHLYH